MTVWRMSQDKYKCHISLSDEKKEQPTRWSHIIKLLQLQAKVKAREAINCPLPYIVEDL